MESKRDISAPLEALQAILATAKELLGDLGNDPLLRRLLEAFATLPPADREPILRVFERDATWTRIVSRSATDTGIRVRPNPHASLYVHVFDPVTGQPIEPEPSERDEHVMRIGIERFISIVPFLFQEGVYGQWSPAARAAAQAAEPAMRAAVARLAHEVLAMIADADATAGSTNGGRTP